MSGARASRDSAPALDAMLAAALRGECGGTALACDARGEAALLERIDFHGIAGLLHDRLSAGTDLPPGLGAALRARKLAQLGWEARHRREIGALVAALDAEGLAPIVFKGTACAHMLYPEPADRARADTDILIAPPARRRAEAVLGALGFRPADDDGADLVRRQAAFRLVDRQGWAHAVDLHWQISNAALLAGLFSHAELLARSVALPALGPGARGPEPVDALLIAAMHRRVHQGSPVYLDGRPQPCVERLIWLCDIDLLARSFGPEDWDRLRVRARAKGLATACADGLRAAHAAIGTPLPADVLAALRASGQPERVERYLSAGPAGRFWMNLAAQSGTAARLGYLRQVVFPPSAYMRARFSGAAIGWLPLLYARRGLAGIADRLGGRGSGR